MTPKGDNSDSELSSLLARLSRAGRPLRTCSSSATKYTDGDFTNSDNETDFTKVQEENQIDLNPMHLGRLPVE